jgi:prepilin-type N-terminal cleavage/methylation domain-containing protein
MSIFKPKSSAQPPVEKIQCEASRRENPNFCFTLIELLVVIAIIAVLIAILLPALGRARASAQTAVCTSNTKQYGMAVVMYNNDFNQIPFFGTEFPDTPSTKYVWDMLAPYTGFTGITACPTGGAEVGGNYGWFYTAGSPITGPFYYGRQKVAGKYVPSKPIRIEQIPSPSKYMLFMDVQKDFGRVYTPTNWFFTYDYDSDGKLDSYNVVYPYNGGAPQVHHNGCNAGLADGHAEWVSFDKLWAVDSNSLVTNSFWYWDR